MIHCDEALPLEPRACSLRPGQAGCELGQAHRQFCGFLDP